MFPHSSPSSARRGAATESGGQRLHGLEHGHLPPLSPSDPVSHSSFLPADVVPRGLPGLPDVVPRGLPTWCREGYQCRPESAYCDLKNDCTDCSDEEPEQCYSIYKDMRKDLCKPQGLVRCPNDPGYCIDPQEVCDSIPQCSDGSDEFDCFAHTCQPGQIHCPITGYCAKGRLCDGTPDCFGEMGEEDENPDFCQGYACPAGWKKCADGLQCVEAGRWCDGAVNCLDGSDEGAVCVVPPPPPPATGGSGTSSGGSSGGSGVSNSSSTPVVLSKEEIAKLKKLAQEKKAAAMAAKKQKMEAKRVAEEEKTKQRAAKNAAIEAKIKAKEEKKAAVAEKKAAAEAKKKQQAEKEAAIAEKKRKQEEKAAAIEAKKKKDAEKKAAIEAKKKQQAEKEAAIAEKKRKQAEKTAAIEAKKKKQAEKAAAVAAKNKATTK
ncbi:unnamed protein product [Closterium sp. Naga37s-1]|nr:unnamed protein product [Closterium sp. Naga37s-1]